MVLCEESYCCLLCTLFFTEGCATVLLVPAPVNILLYNTCMLCLIASTISFVSYPEESLPWAAQCSAVVQVSGPCLYNILWRGVSTSSCLTVRWRSNLLHDGAPRLDL